MLHYGVLALLGILCLGIIARALWSLPDLYAGPCCGACGHGVAEILQGVCPECGGQYARVGITTPGMAIRLRGSLGLALIAWTTLVLVGACFSHGWLEQRAWATAFYGSSGAPVSGARQTEHLATDFTPMDMGFSSFSGGQNPTSLPKEELGYRISLTLDTVMNGDAVESGTCLMKLRRSGEPESLPLTIDLADGSFTIKDAEGKEIAKGAGGKDAKVDDAAIEKWFKAAGLDPDGPAVKRSMKDAAKIARYARADPAAIDEMGMNGTFTSADDGALHMNGSSRSSGGAMIGVGMGSAMIGLPGIGTTEMVLMVGILGAVYLAGCGGIIWRNKRMVKGRA